VYDYDRAAAKTSNGKKLLDLPGGGNHTTRTIKIVATGTQKRLLVSIGSSCNVCTEQDLRRAAVWQADLPDGTNFRSYATGLRNSVFMSTRPGTNELWATEMGRDLLGDDTPPDEINILTEGKNYGWPICYGHNIHDTNFDRNQYIQDPCANSVPAHIDIPAHSAPLGLTFLGQSWPKEFQGDLLVALHGSWNRSVPSGYKIVRYKLAADGSVLSSSDFLTGFLPAKSKTALGRPVDILDASTQDTRVLYVSDDKAGVIYQIKYQNK
jgi:glucose/arabinose dehydrogenase